MPTKKKVNSDDKKIEQPVDLEVKVARSPDYKLFYADRSEFRVSPFDFKINFFSTMELPNKETLLVDQATLILSPQHAKQLSEVLATNVASYETSFGEINMEWEKIESPQLKKKLVE